MSPKGRRRAIAVSSCLRESFNPQRGRASPRPGLVPARYRKQNTGILRTQQAHGVHVFGLASAAVPAGASLTHAPVQARGGASPVGALAVLASALRGGNGADAASPAVTSVPTGSASSMGSKVLRRPSGWAMTSTFQVDDRTAEHHSSRRRRVDVPVAVGHRQRSTPRCPALQRWAGFSKGWMTRGAESAVGVVVACAAGDELNGVVDLHCPQRGGPAPPLPRRQRPFLGYLSTRFVHIALAARTHRRQQARRARHRSARSAGFQCGLHRLSSSCIRWSRHAASRNVDKPVGFGRKILDPQCRSTQRNGREGR